MCAPSVDDSYQKFAKKEAERARAEEEARQARVDDGLAHIRAVFEGGEYGGNTYQGTAPFLAQREQAQRDYYLPQLDREFGRAREQLTYALSRAGLLNSSVAGERTAELIEQSALRRGEVLSQIASDIAGTKTTLNQNRSSVEAGLRASGDASSAVDQALNSVVTFRQDQPVLSPLGHIFAGLSEGIGAARQGYATGQIVRAATPAPLNTNAGRVVT